MDVFELLRCALIPGFLIALIGLGYFFKKSRDLKDQISRAPNHWNVACDHQINQIIGDYCLTEDRREGCRFVIKHEVEHLLLAHDLKGCFFCNEEEGK